MTGDRRSSVTYITGCVPNLPWWRALAMTDQEIAAYNKSFLKEETFFFEAHGEAPSASLLEIGQDLKRPAASPES